MKHGRQMGEKAEKHQMGTPHNKGGENTTKKIQCEMVEYPKASQKNGYK